MIIEGLKVEENSCYLISLLDFAVIYAKTSCSLINETDLKFLLKSNLISKYNPLILCLKYIYS